MVGVRVIGVCVYVWQHTAQHTAPRRVWSGVDICVPESMVECEYVYEHDYVGITFVTPDLCASKAHLRALTSTHTFGHSRAGDCEPDEG